MSAEIDELISRYFDEELTAEEHAALGSWIKADTDHARKFAQQVMLHDRLFDLIGNTAQPLVALPKNSNTTAARSFRYPILATITTMAASLLLIVGYVIWNNGGGDVVVPLPSKAPFATLMHIVDAGEAFSLQQGDRLSASTLKLPGGIALLRFDDGVEVTIQGPADYELIAPGHTRLTSGRLAATVPPGAEGFRVDTPSAEIVDLGTAFGVEMDSTGDTNVSVFDGEVEVGLPDSTEKQKLLEGQAVRIQSGEPIETVEFDVAPFEKIWPVASGIAGSSGDFRFLPPWPRRIRFIRSDQTIFIQPAGYRVQLSRPLIVNISSPGDYSREEQLLASEIPTGQTVRSFVLHYQPEAETRPRDTEPITGSITFDRPVIGVIVLQEELLASRAQLSNRNSGEANVRRQLELTGGRLGDTVLLSADRRTVKLTLTSPGRSSDLLRIVVDAGTPVGSDGVQPNKEAED